MLEEEVNLDECLIRHGCNIEMIGYPSTTDQPDHPPPGLFTWSLGYFKVDVALPLHPFLVSITNAFELALDQLTSNSYQFLCEIYVACVDLQVPEPIPHQVSIIFEL